MSQSGDVIVGGGGVTIVTGLPLNGGGGGGGGGSTTLAGLSDVSVAGATNGQVLTYNGTVWVAAAPAGGVPTSRQVIAGTGLSGGGDLTADRTLAVVFGTTAGTVCQGNDARLSDARTPTAHTHAAADITTGTLATARLGSGTANSTTFLRGDQTWATVTAGVTDHGALTGLADDDHTQYLIGNVGTSTTRNIMVVGSAGRGLDVRMTDSTDTAIQVSNAVGTAQLTITADNGIDCTGGGGGFTGTFGTFSAQVITGASTTSAASLRLPHGTAPTSPVNGDIWTTTSGVFARVNGSTVGPIGVPPGSTNQIIRNVSGAFAASSDLTFDASSNGGLSVLNGHFIFGGSLPSRHTATSGFKAIWVGGDTTNAALIGENFGGYKGMYLAANQVRQLAGGWFSQDTTQPTWRVSLCYEQANTDFFVVSRAPATTGGLGGVIRHLFKIDRNHRAVFNTESTGDPTTTTGFTAKLAVDNVGGTASDAVLLLRGNASQSGNYLTTQTSGGSALTTIGTNGELTVRQGTSTVRLQTDGTGIGFFGVTPVARPTVTGSRGGNAALASFLTAMANLGLITDSTTA